MKIEDVKAFSKSLNEPEFMLNTRLDSFNNLKNNLTSVFNYGLNISSQFEVNISDLNLNPSSLFEIRNSGKATTVNLNKVEYNEVVQQNIMKNIDVNHRLIAINTLFRNSGLLIHLPKDTDCKTIYIKLPSQNFDFSHVLVIAEEGSKATIIEDAKGNAVYKSQVVEIIAKQNSRINYAAVQKLSSGKNFTYKKAVLANDSNVEWLDIVTGSDNTKSEIHIDLKGEGSKGSILNVFFGNKKQQFDFISECNHIARNTESLMMTSGALRGNSKAIQQGFAKIGAKAYNSKAIQKSKILLLSEGAKASPIPKLEIDNNDVTATHEASVGQIDFDKIFYLMSRGLDDHQARKLYVQGFFEQYARKITVPELRQDIENAISERMESD